MTKYEKQSMAIQEASEVGNLLEHIGWIDVISPKLEKLKATYLNQLPAMVLNSGLQVQMGMTKEQLAGKIEGLNYIIYLIEKILRDGEKAFVELNTPE